MKKIFNKINFIAILILIFVLLDRKIVDEVVVPGTTTWYWYWYRTVARVPVLVVTLPFSSHLLLLACCRWAFIFLSLDS